MEFAFSAARWVVGKALAPVADGLLEAWAARENLGCEVDGLMTELQYAQAMLNNTRGRDIDNPALNDLLLKLRLLAYDADDVLDELDYFRIQDELDGTYHAADEHARGCTHGILLNARHTARHVANKFKLSSSSPGASSRANKQEDGAEGQQGCFPGVLCSCGGRAVSSSPPSPTNQDDKKAGADAGCMTKVTSAARNTTNAVGKWLPCCSSLFVDGDARAEVLEDTNMPGRGRQFLCGACPSQVPHRRQTVPIPPKLKFDRVDISTRMTEIINKLKPICAKVSTVLNLELLGSKGTTTASLERPTTSEEITEPKLYGRETEQKSVVDSITHGECFANELTVLPIVGPGGIGKTTFTQHVYQEVRSHFDVTVWICVSLDFNASRLAQEAVTKIPEVKDEKKSGSDQELIEQRLKGKRFLLVLDDIWKCHEDDWEKLLAPFRKGGRKGNIVIVTTRMSDVAQMVKMGDSQIQLDRLGAKDFREFFDACVSTKHESWSDHPLLLEIGEEIIIKLKCSPLAAKTVGRLLRKQLNLEHWRRVLESKEWELQTSDNDIMPALKISYDYLPLNLKQCFSYCALFPEDYEFDSKELIHFWIGLDVLHLGDHTHTISIEDVGNNYLIDLVNYGFFKKNENDNGRHYYVIHDLLHELAVKVSRYDCLSIQISKVRSVQIPASVRHLSIIVDNKDAEDMIAYKDCEKDLGALDKRLQVETIRTLMLFGENVDSFSKTFGSLFKQAKSLRTIFLSGARNIVEDMLQNFSKLVHLRYLRIKMSHHVLETSLPGTIARLYHLKILDIKDSRGLSFPSRYLSNLVNMQHFLVPGNNSLHSYILNVGNLKLLRELRIFKAKKESNGFELKQLAQLLELEVLGIYNLEKVKVKEEAVAIKLIQKHHLQELILDWDINRSNKDPVGEENILENLRPHSNLYKLSITGHGGDSCPSWLGMNLSVKTLESLQLTNVSWKKFPPLGKLWFVDEHGEECLSYIPEQSFKNLKRLALESVPKLTKWVGNGPSDLFSHLEVLIIKDCPELMELPFSHHARHEQEDEANMTWFPKLEQLEIRDCPKLSSLPCVPWSSSTRSAEIAKVGSGIEKLSFTRYSGSGHWLDIKGNDAVDSNFWRVVAFHNLSKLEVLVLTRCPPLSLVHLEKLSSLKSLWIDDIGDDAFCSAQGDGHVGYQFPVKYVRIAQYGGGGQRLTRLLSYFPNLVSFEMVKCEKLTELGVVGLQKRIEALPGPPSISVNEVEDAQVGQHEQLVARAEEVAATSEGVLLLPPQLQRLRISDCQNLVLCPPDHDEDTGRMGVGGLQGLTSLTSLWIQKCPRFLSSYSSSSSSPCFPFPTSLEELYLNGVEGMETRHLLVQGRLTKLTVRETPNFFSASEFSLSHEQELQSSSSKLQELVTNDVAGVLAAPICTLLASSLTELHFCGDKEVGSFTKEQEEAIQLLTSLESIRFWECDRLQRLPAGLHRLPNLKILDIYECAAIRSLPKDGLPSSLQELEINSCPSIRSIPKEYLPNSLQNLLIKNCLAIKSLPKVEDLPSSLRKLVVCDGNSKELRRQCRKFTGTIPIVRA